MVPITLSVLSITLRPRWTATAEYKKNSFSNKDGSISINNRMLTFGLSYYFDIPLVAATKVEATGPELAIPEPVLAPEAVPEAPPPP